MGREGKGRGREVRGEEGRERKEEERGGEDLDSFSKSPLIQIETIK